MCGPDSPIRFCVVCRSKTPIDVNDALSLLKCGCVRAPAGRQQSAEREEASRVECRVCVLPSHHQEEHSATRKPHPFHSAPITGAQTAHDSDGLLNQDETRQCQDKMESKLQSLKVAELKALLTSAGLAVSGNKPDLIQRLLENPAATASLGGGEEAPAVASPAPAPAATAAPPTVSQPATSTPTPAPASAPAPAADTLAAASPTTAETSATQPSEPSEEERRQQLIAELEKRKARAAKFGQPLGEAERKLERAIKFGLDPTEEANVAKLGQALGIKSSKPASTKPAAAAAKESKPKETEEQKQARSTELEVEKEKARKRAERFGIVTKETPEEVERKRKREAKFGASNGKEKKVKT